ncbi:MAG: hypothetical protein AB8G77_27190 [Rhodothermales bacterium]
MTNRLNRLSACLSGLAAIFLLIIPGNLAYGQSSSCQQELVQAEQAYTLGSFDETVRLADVCLNKQGIPEADRKLAFRLKGLSFIGKGLEVDAKEAVKRLLELIPSFSADPIQDPPAFVSLIEEVRNELNARGADAPLTVTQTGTQPQVAAGPTNERNRLEKWYTNWGLGIPFIQYPDEFQSVLDQLESVGLDNTALMFDLLGFYWPLGEQTMIGTSLNAWGDQYSGGGESFQISAFTLGASVMHFLQNRIGDGVFLRADAGVSRLGISSSLESDITSEVGLGFLIGGGYGIPVSRETRILIHLNYSVRIVESENYGNLGLSVSGLF